MKKTASPEVVKKFYQNLGKLFYAVAATDNVVRQEEIAALKELVEKEWVHLDAFTDEYGTDAAYQIEILFDWLEENQPLAESAFQDFKNFKMENQDLFDSEMKNLIMRTADKIADAFAGKNKSELVMLSKLQGLL